MKEAKAIGNSLTKETLEQDVNRLTSRGNKPNVTKTGAKSKRVCYRCGSTQHIASDPNCKARDKKCRNCKKIGHFAVMCRSKPITQTKNDVREVTTQNSTGPPAYHIPSNPGDGNYEVLANDSNGRKSSKSKRIRCVVMINGVPIQLDVDTGSGVSILSEEVFSKSFLSEALVKVPEGIKLSSYTKHKIEVIGCFEATVSYLDRVANTLFFVVKSGSNLLGRDLIQKLGINILGSQLSCFALSEDSSSNNPVIQGYLSKYIPNFAQLVEPLRAILRKGNEFKWSTECQSSFDQLKSLISKDLVLAMYDPELEEVVRTDASQDGLGVCLNQLKDDPLSRVPAQGTDECITDDDQEIICQVLWEPMKTDNIIPVTGKYSSRLDPSFQIIRKYIAHGWPRFNQVNDCVKPYYLVRDELCLVDDVMLRGEKVVIPSALTQHVLAFAHEAHQGMSRTKQRLRELYWWPLMDAQVEELVKTCAVCSFNDKTAKRAFAPLQPIQFPDGPWEKIAIDIVGPFERAVNECRFAITAVDYYSKWPEVMFTPSVETNKVLDFLKQIFSREGFPKEIVTDNGVQFKSYEFQNFMSERGIKHCCSSLYYPQANGAVERFNAVLKNTVQNAIHSGRSWKEAVLQFLGIYRATAHATTGVSPSVLAHGRHMRTKLNIVGRDLPRVDMSDVRDRVQEKQRKYKFYADKRRNTRTAIFNVGDWEHDDGSENPKTVFLENTHKKAYSGQVQTKPSVNSKQSEDVSREGEHYEVEAVATEGEQRHSSQDGMQEDYSYGGEKLLRGNVSDAFIPEENHGPESVEKQEASIASRVGVDKAVAHMADVKKTYHEFKDPSKKITPTSPRQPPTLTRNFKKDQTNSMSAISKTKKKTGNFSGNKSWRKATVTGVTGFINAFLSANLGDFGVVGLSGFVFLIWSFCPETSVACCNTYEPGCSVAGSSRKDRVLDALDVKDSLDGRVFNGSGRGYNGICSTAFQDFDVSKVDLSNTSLMLPNCIFDHTSVERFDISDNNYVEFPSALNSSNHIQFLDSSNNMIDHIPGGTMNAMRSLSVFDLSGNEGLKQVPEDIFFLMKYFLKKVMLHKTQVKHPLVPPPQNMVCMKDNPCNVTHREGYVSIERNGSEIFFYIDAVECEGVKKQLEANYEVLAGELRCENNVLNGSVVIVRKDVSVVGTTYEPNQPDLTTISVPTTDIVTDLGKAELPTTGIDQDTGVGTTPSSEGKQSDLTNGKTEVPTRDSDLGTYGGICLSTKWMIILVFFVFVISGCIGALGHYCFVRASSKKTEHIANGTVGGNPSDQPITESSPLNIEESKF
ncbi:hypothetical protein HOLleu_37501 [Holothuria leucospilota]|uniref:Endonuclease n=1 Tax=Holothuria leucospilota TaxID=206669 RepID=A0A9Q1BFB7_HOLLE|nr:hypothetical protein HOLleu_37501 [Holothuria leucospilota]